MRSPPFDFLPPGEVYSAWLNAPPTPRAADWALALSCIIISNPTLLISVRLQAQQLPETKTVIMKTALTFEGPEKRNGRTVELLRCGGYYSLPRPEYKNKPLGVSSICIVVFASLPPPLICLSRWRVLTTAATNKDRNITSFQYPQPNNRYQYTNTEYTGGRTDRAIITLTSGFWCAVCSKLLVVWLCGQLRDFSKSIW